MKSLLCLVTILYFSTTAFSATVTLQDLEGFVGVTDEDTQMAKKLIGMDLPNSTWSQEQLQVAIRYSERIIWDCSQQIVAIETNRELYASTPNLKEDLIRERAAAVLIHNLAQQSLIQKQTP